MTGDARISTALPSHPKTKKLIRRAGVSAAWHLVVLFLWVADNRSDGDLAGMSDEDIELAVDWPGDEGQFVRELVAVGFLDGEEGSRSVHDWEEHNPWAAGSGKRAEKSRWAALCKQHGRHEAALKMPEYAERLRVASEGRPHAVPNSASGTANEVPAAASRMPPRGNGSAPSPSPSPLPSPLPSPIEEPTGSSCAEPETGIDAAAPRPVVSIPLVDGTDFAVTVADVQEWQGAFPGIDVASELLQARIWCKDNPTRRKTAKGVRRFLSGWLGKEQDRGGANRGPKPGVPPPLVDGKPWWQIAGFDSVEHAMNFRCNLANFREFSEGKRKPVEASA